MKAYFQIYVHENCKNFLMFNRHFGSLTSHPSTLNYEPLQIYYNSNRGHAGPQNLPFGRVRSVDHKCMNGIVSFIHLTLRSIYICQGI
jgi:hypothetical protein